MSLDRLQVYKCCLVVPKDFGVFPSLSFLQVSSPLSHQAEGEWEIEARVRGVKGAQMFPRAFI